MFFTFESGFRKKKARFLIGKLRFFAKKSHFFGKTLFLGPVPEIAIFACASTSSFSRYEPFSTALAKRVSAVGVPRRYGGADH